MNGQSATVGKGGITCPLASTQAGEATGAAAIVWVELERAQVAAHVDATYSSVVGRYVLRFGCALGRVTRETWTVTAV